MRLSKALTIFVIFISIQFVYAKNEKNEVGEKNTKSENNKNEKDELVELRWKHLLPLAYEINFKDNPKSKDENSNSDYTMVAVIKPKSKDYSIKFILDNIIGLKDKLQADTINSMGLLGSVQIRADVNNKGEIKSFWLERKQANMVALMFQLPPKPVKAGDSWPVDVNLISFDGNFICSYQDKKNLVTLVRIEKETGKRKAVLNYNITEKVSGKYMGSDIECEMRYSGKAVFLIDEGRFESQKLNLSVNSKGMQVENLTQLIDVKLLPKVPIKYLQVE
jgi:hypothetical protein